MSRSDDKDGLEIPETLDALQIWLGIDRPVGPRVALLRDHYADRPETVDNSHACVDECNDYLEFEVFGCWVCGAPIRRPDARTCVEHADREPMA